MPEAGPPESGTPSSARRPTVRPAKPVEVRVDRGANGSAPTPPAITDPHLRTKFGFGDDETWLAKARRATASPLPGRIGPYEILCQIGRGGQGAVYKALQPGTGREIAIKRLSAGAFADEAARARFRREVETSAALSHPGVVTVFGYDSVDGQQLLLMEYVCGAPIDRWASPETGPRLPWRDILTLFVQVCDAVSHAHQRGVIHRDLKPSNILVDEQGRARVLDFGLAKVLGPQWPIHADSKARAGGMPPTRSSMDSFVGTPMFAAPEQVDGRLGSTDTRTDVYALGAVLFQLLCGHTPFDPGSSLAALFDSIRVGVSSSPSSCSPSLPRELDCIVMKAMSLDPAARYQSVDALADDLRRALAGKAVLAHPPSALYTARAFVRRHPVGVMLAATAAVALTTMGVLSSALAWQLSSRQADLRASLDRERGLSAVAEHTAEVAVAAQKDAEAQAGRHVAAAGFLTRLLESTHNARLRGEDLTAKTMLRTAAAQLSSGELANQPEVEASLTYAVARAFMDVDDNRSAKPFIERALAANLGLYGPKHLKSAESLYLAGLLAERNGYTEDAILKYESAASTLRELGEDKTALFSVIENNLGVTLRDVDRLEESEAVLRHALALRRELFGEISAEAATSLRNLGYCICARDRYDEGRAMIAEGVDVATRVFGPQHERTRLISIYLARADLNAGHVAEAVALLEQLREEAINSLGPDSSQVMTIEFRLSTALTRAGNLDRAIEMLDRVLRYGARLNDSESVRQPTYRVRLANLLLDQGRFAEAKTALDTAANECPAGPTGDEVRATIAKARERLAALPPK